MSDVSLYKHNNTGNHNTYVKEYNFCTLNYHQTHTANNGYFF